MKNPILIAAFFFAASAGMSVGYFHAPEELTSHHRVPSSVKEEPPPVKYETMHCPSEEEYRRLAAIVKLEVPTGIDACAHEHHGKIARLLFYASTLKINFAPDWAPSLHEDLGSPLAYLGRMSRKMGIDLSQSTTIAYNKTNLKEIYLGGLFFSEEPLEALSVLVHEARHSSEHDAGHVTCRRGDIPKTPGGCDRELSVDPLKAGAYSYGAAFYAAMGLYAEDLGSADRKYMLNLSMATVSTRFNELPEELAHAYDLLALLDEQGEVSLLHPFLREPVPLSLSFLKEGERVERLEFNVKNNGLLLFTNAHRLFTWDPVAGFERLFASTLPENLPIYEAARVRVPFEDYAYYNFLTAENQLYYYRFQAENRKYELTPYPIFPKNSVKPEISRFFMGLSARTVFLGKDGQFYISPRFGDELPFDPKRELQIPGRQWVSGTGGVVYESLYGLTDDGRTHYAKVDFVPGGYSTYDTEVYSLHESSLQANPGRLGRKIFEGLNLRALLDTDGNLQLEYYGRDKRTHWRKTNGGPRLVDFTILRKHSVARSLLASEARTQFTSTCQMKKVVPDPWFGAGMGLNQAGELVVGGISVEQPCLVAGAEKFKALRIESGRSSGAGHSRSREERNTAYGDAPSSTRATLWLTGMDGMEKPLLPYEFR